MNTEWNDDRINLKHGLGFHQWADGAHTHGHCTADDTAALQLRVSESVDEIVAWMRANRLKLNSEKTERIWLGTHLG